MSTIIHSRGSQTLAGAASLKHRIPVVGVDSRYLDVAQWQQRKLSGSTPDLQTTCLVGNRMSRVPGFVPAGLQY